MRKFKLSIILMLFFGSFSLHGSAAILLSNTQSFTGSAIDLPSTTVERVVSMKIREFEKLLGRKLSLKEKIGLKLAQHKIKRELRSAENDKAKGQTAMILGIIGLAMVVIPYGVLASIPLAILAIVFGSQAKKQNKNDGKAQTGIILGIVTLGLIALAIAVVIIALAAWGWGW